MVPSSAKLRSPSSAEERIAASKSSARTLSDISDLVNFQNAEGAHVEKPCFPLARGSGRVGGVSDASTLASRVGSVATSRQSATPKYGLDRGTRPFAGEAPRASLGQLAYPDFICKLLAFDIGLI